MILYKKGDNTVKQWFTTAEIAQMTNLTQGRIRQLVHAGEITGEQRAGVWFFGRRETRRFLGNRGIHLTKAEKQLS